MVAAVQKIKPGNNKETRNFLMQKTTEERESTVDRLECSNLASPFIARGIGSSKGSVIVSSRRRVLDRNTPLSNNRRGIKSLREAENLRTFCDDVEQRG